jgi:hypothetical protein
MFYLGESIENQGQKNLGLHPGALWPPKASSRNNLKNKHKKTPNYKPEST